MVKRDVSPRGQLTQARLGQDDSTVRNVWLMSDRDETRPITCVKCGRSFRSPRWVGLQGPLCGACYERLQREEGVRLHHAESPDSRLAAWIKSLFGR